jgi:hypothetical protein
MRPPASASENRIHGAEKIGLSRYSDFFNRIVPFATFQCGAEFGRFRGEADISNMPILHGTQLEPRLAPDRSGALFFSGACRVWRLA